MPFTQDSDLELLFSPTLIPAEVRSALHSDLHVRRLAPHSTTDRIPTRMDEELTQWVPHRSDRLQMTTTSAATSRSSRYSQKSRTRASKPTRPTSKRCSPQNQKRRHTTLSPL